MDAQATNITFYIFKRFKDWSAILITSIQTTKGIIMVDRFQTKHLEWQQEDRTSSGLFMLKYMEHWNAKSLEKEFTQNLINEFRKKLAAMLVNSPHNEEGISRDIVQQC